MTYTLFEIQTSEVSFVWRQTKQSRQPSFKGGDASPPFGLYILEEKTKPRTERIFNHQTSRLFEQTDYSLFVKSNTNQSVRLWHRDPLIRSRLHYTDTATIGHGIINFGSQIGTSRFTIELDGLPYISFEVEIVPSKLDYYDDYLALRDDLEEIVHGLVDTYLRATYQKRAYTTRPEAPSLAWLQILEHVFDDLVAACQFIHQHPYQYTIRKSDWVPITRIRRTNTSIQRAIAAGKGSGPRSMSPKGYPMQTHLYAERSHYTLDTPEHRWLAFAIHHIEARLTSLLAGLSQAKHTARQQAILEYLTRFRENVRDILRKKPFLFVKPALHFPEVSMVLQGAPGYREAYRSCLALRQSLSIQGSIVDASIKDLHVLYEYWCYLTIVRLLAQITDHLLPHTQLLTTYQDGLDLRLQKGQRQRLVFHHANQQIECIYNPRFSGRGYVVPQQPDIALTIRSPHQTVQRYILDAKYRLDNSPGYIRRYGTPGPPTDALNTLHRYRDAIRDEKGSETSTHRTVVQAIALFPYREPSKGAFAKSILSQTLADVGVGALPALPKATSYVESWLTSILNNKE